MSIPYGFRVPFIEHLGMTLESFENGVAQMRYTAQPEHLNAHGITHGGACMTLLDVAMAAAARSLQHDMGVLTIEMKTSFMRAATGPLLATARLLHRTGRMAFVEGRIEDASGQICAHATATFKFVPRTASTQTIPTD